MAVPAIKYTADAWYTGIHTASSGKMQLGSVVVTKRLALAQCQAAKTITSALSMVAGDILDAHAFLFPTELLFYKVLFWAAVHLSSLSKTHPLSLLVHKAARPNYSPPFYTNVQNSKDAVQVLATASFFSAPVAVYCDGSGLDAGIGASAVLYVNGVETNHLCYHLGHKSEHTVYEAET
ncbi:hypothetical protein C0993_003011, partial [Termitomyces sp. T159_Od127]